MPSAESASIVGRLSPIALVLAAALADHFGAHTLAFDALLLAVPVTAVAGLRSVADRRHADRRNVSPNSTQQRVTNSVARPSVSQPVRAAANGAHHEGMKTDRIRMMIHLFSFTRREIHHGAEETR